jgi:hypothetical protein
MMEETDNLFHNVIDNNHDNDDDNIVDLGNDEVEVNFDMDITQYTIDDLVQLFSLDIPLKKHDIETKLNTHISNVGEERLISFFKNAKTMLLQEYDSHAPVVNFQTNIVEGYINPYHQEITSKLIHVDTQLIPFKIYTPSDFTCNFEESLCNVISIKLVSVEIPRTWYSFTKIRENTFFFIIHENTNTQQKIEIENGNYDIQSIKEAIENATQNNIEVRYQLTNNKITLVNNYDHNISIRFFTEPPLYTISQRSKRFSLGWCLGFRGILYDIPIGEQIIADSLFHAHETRYLFIVFNDHNTNQVSNHTVGITNTPKVVNLPSYYNCNLDESDPTLNKDGSESGLTDVQAGVITTILEERRRVQLDGHYHYRHADVIARISLGSGNMGDIVTLQSSRDINETRNYFGPVTLEKCSVTLLDDRGKIVDLNGLDWSFALVCKMKYDSL